MPELTRQVGKPATPRDSAERGIAAVLAVGNAMSTAGNHVRMLADVIAVACEAIGAKTGGFMRYEAVSDELILEAPAFGVENVAQISRYRVALSDGGNAARVFQSREPYLANDAEHDPRFIQRFVRLFDTRNTISVPLVLHDRAIGIFHAINKDTGDFTEQDLADLLLVAPLLAACLQSAMTLRALEAERAQLARSMTAHQELLNSALNSHGFESLCHTLHQLTGRPVLMWDTLRRPLAMIEWQLDPNRPLFEASTAAAGRVWYVDIEVPSARLAVVTIALGSETGGYLIVDLAQRPLDAIDVQAIEQAAIYLAAAIFQRRTARATESRAASALLLDLFAGDLNSEEALRIVQELGFQPNGPWRVLLFEVRAGEERVSGSTFFRLGPVIRDALDRGLGDQKKSFRPMLWRDGFVIVCDSKTTARFAERSRLRRLNEAMSSISHEGRPLSLRLGIGRSERFAGKLIGSLKTAEQALRALARLPGKRQVMSFEELGVYRLLLGTNQVQDQREFAEEVLEPILCFDRENKRETLLKTLRALVSCNFNMARTARQLDIHINTMKYRSRQLGSLLGGDINSNDRRLEFELALKILDLE